MGELAFHLPAASNVFSQDFHLWNGYLFEVDPVNQSNFSQLVALQKRKKEERKASCQPSYFYNWRRKWQATLVLLPEESHGQRGQAGYSPWSHKESDRTGGLTLSLQRKQRIMPWVNILLKVARVVLRQIHPFKKKVVQILTASVGSHVFLL